MSEQNIKCPKCRTSIPLTEALTGQIEDALRAKLDAESARRTAELDAEGKALAKQANELETKAHALEDEVTERLREERKKIAEQERAKVEADYSEQTKALEEELAEKRRLLTEANKNELGLRKRQRELEEKAESIDLEIQQKVAEERGKIIEQEKAKILTEQAEQTKAYEQELQEKRTQLAEASKNELALLKKQRELEERTEALDLEVQRKLTAERKKIADEAGAKAAEEQLLKLREKDDKIEAMTKQINDLKRKAEQGSQESQGEALEGALQDLLQQTFPFDRFEEVKKGQKGADILQVVRNPAGRECGKILWESKHTKEFSNKWIEKVKGDQQEAAAEIAAIVSVALPKGIRGFGPYEAVWLTDFASCPALAAALRFGLINAAREKALAANQETLKDVIYKYVTGQEFTMQIRAIADAFIRMKEELDREKRAMERIWKSRERQLETVISNIGGIRGSLEGYLGPKVLPAAEQFALDAGVVEDEP